MSLIARSSVVGCALALTLIVGGCAATTAQAPVVQPEAPTTEQPLVPVSDDYVILYSGREETLVKPLIDLFTERTGITVDVRYAGTSELAALLLEEGSQSPAGVFFSQDAGALGALGDAGLFVSLADEITSRVLPEFSSTDSSWVGVTGRARVVVYDSQSVKVEDLPTDIDQVVGPQWSGKVAVAPGNASFQSFVTAYRVMRGEGAADQWVSGLGINNPQIFEKNGAILEAVNDGIVPLGLINHYYWHRLAAERGVENMRAQLHFTPSGDPGSIVNVTGAGVLKAQEADLDAYTLVAFLVSDEAQRYFVENTFEYPLVPGIDAPAGVPPLSSLVVDSLDLSDLRSLAETQLLLQRYGLIL